MDLYQLIRPLFFQLEPENAHNLALNFLKWLPRAYQDSQPKTVMGLQFPNAVGLAAGFDKNGAYSDRLFKLGFGFIEIGTLTPRPQIGNPKPRLFRLQEDEALINRMGFNNLGVDHYVQQYAQLARKGPLGINIGKNKDTPLSKAIDDYQYGYEKVYQAADYVTVNVSSPNTPDLRSFEKGESLEALLTSLKDTQMRLSQQHSKYTPLVVKISPDLSEHELIETAHILRKAKCDGVIATNTTVKREGLCSSFKSEAGGLSGRPVREASTQVIATLSTLLDGIPIIAAGGIMSGRDALEKIQAGASLVQIYTGFIYQGPQLVQQIIKSLS